MNTKVSHNKIKYFQNTLSRHIKNYFHSESISSFENANIEFIPYEEINDGKYLKPGTIIIPIFSNITSSNLESWQVDFRGTRIKIWDFIKPPNDRWKIDNPDSPLWYSNSNNIYMPAWNMFGVLFGLISAHEELTANKKDMHGRFTGTMSNRYKNKLLEVPIFNNAAALLVDKCLRIQFPSTYQNILFSKPVNICLSHDLDQLRGDDFWTQFSRLARMISPLKKLKTPEFFQLKFIFQNIKNPRKDFMDDLLKMIELEKKYNFKSVNYVLCGKRGRYGARTSIRYIKEYLSEIPSDFEIGMHYNYNTHLNKKFFLQQKRELENIIGCKISSGRAHYLQMNFHKSYKFWTEMGIKYDESFGYSDCVGYRAGIAGSFFPYDFNSEKSLKILCIPLVAMDSCITNNFGESSVAEIERHISHLNVVGGAFTLLFHPGRHENKEFPESVGMYEKLLALFKKYNAKSTLPSEML